MDHSNMKANFNSDDMNFKEKKARLLNMIEEA
jgi:hypothetical protein